MTDIDRLTAALTDRHAIEHERLPPLAHSIADVIGNTPMLELHRLGSELGVEGRLLCKLDYLNPGFSKKDRIAREMIAEANERGDLTPGQTVVELTSGNTGTGLALVCRALGHPVVLVMSRGNSVERARMMRALGAEVVLVDQAPGSPPGQVSGEDLALVEAKTQAIVEERGAFRADQFHLQANALAHERTTGPEMWRQSGGHIDVFVDFVGSGGTFAGVSRYLRRVNPAVRTYVVEPASVAVLAGCEVSDANHPIQGGGYGKIDLALIDRELITDFIQVTGEEATEATRLLAQREGVFAGYSSGANLAAAVKVMRAGDARVSAAFLACDSGLKYLSTSLY